MNFPENNILQPQMTLFSFIVWKEKMLNKLFKARQINQEEKFILEFQNAPIIFKIQIVF
jgi:hypothetical protein